MALLGLCGHSDWRIELALASLRCSLVPFGMAIRSNGSLCAWCTLCPFYHIYSDWQISVPFSDSIRSIARFPTSVSLRKNLSLLVRLFGLLYLRGNVFRDFVYVVSLYHIYDYIR